VGGTRLPGDWVPIWITSGSGGNIYAVAAQGAPGPGEPDTSVFVVSLTGAILHQFALPIGVSPHGAGTPLAITSGPDNNLWITAPGLNEIIRMTATGTISQFPLPTANAGPNRIVAGYDGALFFTETAANKIGRITTSGSVTEYTIPTLNSGSTGITPCSSVHCGVHGGVWFTETAANKIGRFNAPI
jgi:streptogramin lyase